MSLPELLAIPSVCEVPGYADRLVVKTEYVWSRDDARWLAFPPPAPDPSFQYLRLARPGDVGPLVEHEGRQWVADGDPPGHVVAARGMVAFWDFNVSLRPYLSATDIERSVSEGAFVRAAEWPPNTLTTFAELGAPE